jgi:putative ABC transport system ATP-binding protein
LPLFARAVALADKARSLMISAVDIARHYKSGEREVHALDGVSLEIARNEFVAIAGPSGCGKSTFMHLLGGLDTPTRGELYVDGLALHSAGDRALTEYRRSRVGIVFQFFNLLPTMNALENVAFPLLLQGARWNDARERARELLDKVGLGDRAEHFVHQLSGGEQQRTAIARALIQRPKLVLADEPTGNLDSHAAGAILELLQEIAAQELTTLVLVTHSAEVARAASRQVQMRDGKIVSDSRGTRR